MNYQIAFHIFIAATVFVALAQRMAAFIKGKPLSRNIIKTFAASIAVLYIGGLMVAADLIGYADIALGFVIVLASCIVFDLLAYEARRYVKRIKVQT
jgi:hypothetical protein